MSEREFEWLKGEIEKHDARDSREFTALHDELKGVKSDVKTLEKETQDKFERINVTLGKNQVVFAILSVMANAAMLIVLKFLFKV